MKYPPGTQILNKKEEEADEESINPFDQEEQELVQKAPQKKSKQVKKSKKSKKSKKEKKSKKQVKAEQNQESQQEDEYERNSMFDDEAESGEQDQQDGQLQEQFGYQEKKGKQSLIADRYQETYKKSNIQKRFMERFEGKDERQINAQYSKKALMVRKKQEQFPSQKDPKVFIINVQKGLEETMAMQILNKARDVARKQGISKVTIISVMARKKIFPGKIFVEAYEEYQVRDFLGSFLIYMSKKALEVKPRQKYNQLFWQKQYKKIQWKPNQFVRINFGLYEGDLAKIYKVKKSTVDVLVVPRINIQQISKKIEKTISDVKDPNKILQKRQEYFKLLTNHQVSGSRFRFDKKPLYTQEYMKAKDMPGMDKIRLAPVNGLIILNYKPNQLKLNTGTYLPIQLIPFTGQGNFIEQIKEQMQNLETLAQFKKGDIVEVVSGQLKKHIGQLMQIKGRVGLVKCKNKSVKNQILQEPLENLAKYFKQGDNVKIISGLDKGKTGIVLTVEPKEVEIWTDSSHIIKVSRKCLMLGKGDTICEQNNSGLTRFDLIKTKTNDIGIVLKTTKDQIMIIDTNNLMRTIRNMDFDSKIKSHFFVAKNKRGEEIRKNATVIVREGVNQGKKCLVLHVYQQNLFLYSRDFTRSGSVCVEYVDNCLLFEQPGGDQTFPSNRAPGACPQLFDEPQEIKPGSVILLHSGTYKGHMARVIQIRKNTFYVAIPSKGVKTGVARKRLTPEMIKQREQQYYKDNDDNDDDRRRTPRRNYESQSQKGLSMASPARDDE